MIESTGKVEYSKSKTIPCDGINDDDEEEASKYLPVKYEKTLDLENANQTSNAVDDMEKKCQADEMSNSAKEAKSKEIKCVNSGKEGNKVNVSKCEKVQTEVEFSKTDTLDGVTMDTTSEGGIPLSLITKVGVKKAYLGNSPEFSNQAGKGGLPESGDHMEEDGDNMCMVRMDTELSSNGNMYNRNVVSTKYYETMGGSGTGSSGKSRDNAESVYPKEFSSIERKEGEESCSPYGMDAGGMKNNVERASLGALSVGTFATDCSNISKEEKEIFAKMIDDQTKKNIINGGNRNGAKDSEPFCMGTGNFSIPSKDNAYYTNAYVHGKNDNSSEVVPYNHADSVVCEKEGVPTNPYSHGKDNQMEVTNYCIGGTVANGGGNLHDGDGKERLANYPDMLMGNKWSDNVRGNGFHGGGHDIQDEDKCSTEDVIYMGMETSGSRGNQYERDSTDCLYGKKDDLKAIAYHQDIFNDIENMNDSTTECSSSVKDIPQFVANHSGVYSNRVIDKEGIVITSGHFSSYTDANNLEFKNSPSTKSFHLEKEKQLIYDNRGNIPVVSNGPNYVEEEGEKNVFSELVGGEPNKGGMGVYLAGGYNNEALIPPGRNNNLLEKKCVMSEKKVQGGPISMEGSTPVGDMTSSTNGKGGSRNYNASNRDSVHGEGHIPNEALYKKKNETTLIKGQLPDYSRNEKNDESLEEYFKSTIPENILRNIKYENPVSTFNDIVSNNTHYDLTSELRKSNPTNTYYGSGRSGDMGGNKNGETMNNSGAAVASMGIRSRGAVAEGAAVAGVPAIGGRDAYHVQADKGVDTREDSQMARRQNNGSYNYMGNNNYHGSGYNGNGYNGNSYNGNSYNGNGYNGNGYNGMVNRSTRVCNEPESNYASGKRYYMLPPKKCDSVKDQKNQMLMISKQKIKKIWNKFKSGASKDQNLIPTFENEQNLFPNMDVLHASKMQGQGLSQMGSQMGTQIGGTQMNAQINAHGTPQMQAQLGVGIHPQVASPLHTQLAGHVHSDFYGVSGGFQTCNQGGGGVIGVGGGSLMSPFKECISKPIRRGSNVIEKQIKSKCIYNWKLAQKSLLKMLHSAHNYYFNGVQYADWQLTSIPTLGFSKSSNRVQQMYKAVIPSKDGSGKNEVKLFLKKIPIYIWIKQYNLMNEYDGEYVTDGENFVMEATSLAFLNEYHPGITPKLHRILYEPDGKEPSEYNIPPKSMFNSLALFNDILTERLKCNISGNIVIVSEFFSEDILDFIDRRQKKLNMKISNNEKSYILYQCLKLLIRLHDAGLSHLDLTPENILISESYEMRLCDLSKSTPIYTYNLRHVKDVNRLYLFESCEPTIAKGAYMPPECWKIYWKYDTMKIKNPLRDLKNITDQEKRKQFYFDVSSADKFMLGVFFFWIWTNGNLWKCSDPLQDEDFFYFVKCDMNFDKFELTRKWPSDLKNIIKQLLHAEHRKKLNLKDLSMHPWWSCKLQ
ncbi:serine/threonine protein kinase, FIKK family [Plasmodium knowlesi strain H]|uniref:non-specific serine/threonine protein kinase n=3 Tax=Plasmodium knowlesi TaxID=5850 RepID=A0A5K1VR32_PLAKH|nr:serine/threonine protein kinase, FIKK family [Plasmodium knowlesi strain H]OTN68739.1 Serine/threonine protein kinase - FIKK family [Plasmodium knowlesi]CAA9986213.1 serine/threonine protein kinase, FIKK family [Plasmodium knowlesi strain H]SBO25420.1 serine/threonine protein kinase, FIKK family [Plasmodium knowlesi strain H]SBO27705.1 serine/threonine protein kinase, FIKK family [Plasmodium knowlesi strain H]VVS75687.1 serine/threonine protein kinase, FIKK family [Plasmodium knowlesi strai|eukprot:XP_002257622.1 serine/threonine protein kinase, putative [Plasmodium knowlesi strain H]